MKYRIYIEKFTSDDFEKYYSLISDEGVMAMITERAILIEEAKIYYDLLLKNNAQHESFGNFKVFQKETGDFIGLAKLAIEDNNLEEAELGYMLLPEYCGKGYGSEIAKLMLEKAINEKSLKKIVAIIDPNNKASRKILLNNEFVSEKVCEIDGLPGEILSKKL